MIGVIASLKIADGKEQQFETVARDLIEKVTENEPGCLMYELYKSPSEPSSYIFMEKYIDDAALKAHGKTDYFAAAQPALGACLSGPPNIRRFTLVK